MSESNFFVGKYNYSRRMVNHRFPHDFNYDINKDPFNYRWRLSIKNLIVGNIIRNVGVWHSGIAVIFALTVNELAAYLRRDEPKAQTHIYNQPKYAPAVNYVMFKGDHVANKGRWNGNFACWENDPNCGRDFA